MKAVILHNASVLLISGFEVPKGHRERWGGGLETPPQNYKRNQKLQFAVPFFAPPYLIKMTLIEANCFHFF